MYRENEVWKRGVSSIIEMFFPSRYGGKPPSTNGEVRGQTCGMIKWVVPPPPCIRRNARRILCTCIGGRWKPAAETTYGADGESDHDWKPGADSKSGGSWKAENTWKSVCRSSLVPLARSSHENLLSSLRRIERHLVYQESVERGRLLDHRDTLPPEVKRQTSLYQWSG